jgi:2-dehydropantoate 2-reductase
MTTKRSSAPLRIAIIGPGSIGSTFAAHLGSAGHEVTLIGRGTRLEQLRRDGAVVTAAGTRVPVRVADRLDTAAVWDLVLVTVLASDVDALAPTLADSAARTIMFMFNTFAPLEPLRAAVGVHRCQFGFPGVVATIDDGELSFTVLRRGMATTVSDGYWAAVFSEAGIPSHVHDDMQSWLRTHAAMIVPIALAGQSAIAAGRGVSTGEALALARALREGLRLVRRLGSRITPAPLAIAARMPTSLVGAALWLLTRTPVFVRTISAAPVSEPAMLIDEMESVAALRIPALAAVRPPS